MTARALVVAKAPVPGRVKTRLGDEVGMAVAAELAAAALLDTLEACRTAFGVQGCLLALAGDLGQAVRGAEIAAALRGWTLAPQQGDTFADRLAQAHLDVPPGGPVVQVGMDTPQVTPALLHDAAAALADHDAVLGAAPDGGWWVLGLRSPAGARVLRDVAMSAPTTYADTRAALRGAGLEVGAVAELRDVDTVADAHLVAAQAPEGRFARRWQAVAA